MLKVFRAGLRSCRLSAAARRLSFRLATAAVILSGGRVNVSSGASAASTVVSNGGQQVVAIGGSAFATTVSSGGVDFIYGTASSITVLVGGTENVGLSGTLSSATLGGGLLEIRSGGTAGTSRIGFTSAGGTLQLDDSVHFSGTISGFAVPSVIDLRDIAFGSGTTLAYVDSSGSGTLTVGDGTHTANVLMLGSFTSASFNKQSDGNGGTQITHS